MQATLQLFFTNLISWLIAAIPKIVIAIIILVIGWIAGRAFGKAISFALDKIGIDDAIRGTSIGKAIEERTKVSIVTVFDIIARWFIYLVALIAASDALGIPALTELLQAVWAYLPHLAAGVIIIIFGLVAVDFLGDLIIQVGKEQGVEWIDIIGNVFKVFIYFVILIIGLRVMKIDVTLLENIIEYVVIGLAVGVGVGSAVAVGLGVKDVVKKWAEEKYEEYSKKKE